MKLFCRQFKLIRSSMNNANIGKIELKNKQFSYLHLVIEQNDKLASITSKVKPYTNCLSLL